MPDYRIIEGDCVDVMARATPESVDAIVCDPPYGLEFMGKDWDRLGDDAVSRSWDTRGRGDNQPARDAGSPRGRHATTFRTQNPRCRACGRAMQGQSTAKGFKVCECARPDPYMPSTLPRRMQAWHEAWAREALRVLKPGGHLLAFGGTRTYHRLACAIEDAGFEIRDTIAWMYGSGFPKSLDVSKAIDNAAGATREVSGPHPWAHVRAAGADRDDGATYGSGKTRGPLTITAPATPDAERWQGWGTALKPAHEPIVVARKPLAGTVAQNCLTHGTGALNVDGCRIGHDEPVKTTNRTAARFKTSDEGGVRFSGSVPEQSTVASADPLGRWPANVILDPDAAAMLDEQTGTLTSGSRVAGEYGLLGGHGRYNDGGVRPMPAIDGDSGGASRFFYCAKSSSAERNAGLDGFEERLAGVGDVRPGGSMHERAGDGGPVYRRNVHPTVKPIELMRWLVRLVTPPDGTVLDPFAGSGTTGCAAALEGFRFIGIEREPEYAAIARARIAWWAEHPDGMELVERLEHERERRAAAERGQLDLFGGA